MNTHRLVWSLAVLTALFYSACGLIIDADDQKCRVTELCDLACPCVINDPLPHCVRIDGCQDDRDCPSGTLCLPKGDGEPPLWDGGTEEWRTCASRDEKPPEQRCRLASASFDRALIDGFGVNEMTLLAVEGSPSFVFAPPEGARVVACALFGCRPDVRKTRRDVQDDSVGDLVNFWMCSLSGAAKTFELTAASTGESGIQAYTPSVAAGEGDCKDAKCESLSAVELSGRKRQVSEISVGCWAYDDARLIAATRMVPLTRARIDELVNRTQVIADCQSNEDDDRSCVLAADDAALGAAGTDVPRFGTCVGGVCRARCVTAADCVRPPAEASPSASGSGGGGGGGTGAVAPSTGCPAPTVTCNHGLWSTGQQDFVGVCEVQCSRTDLLERDAGVDAEAGVGAGAGGGGSP